MNYVTIYVRDFTTMVYMELKKEELSGISVL